MKNKAVLIIVLLLLGVGAYFGYTKFLGGKLPGSSGSMMEEGGMKSLKDLLSSGVAQKCTYSTADESGNSEGVTYVSGGKVRGDFTTVASGKTMTSHMISDGKTSYVWSDGEKNGFKMTVTEEATGDVETDYSDTSTSSQADLNQQADYKCSGWVVDGSVFTPPTTVTFTDFSQMYAPASAAPAQGGSGDSSQCSYCNALTGDDKTQCLTALKCN